MLLHHLPQPRILLRHPLPLPPRTYNIKSKSLSLGCCTSERLWSNKRNQAKHSRAHVKSPESALNAVELRRRAISDLPGVLNPQIAMSVPYKYNFFRCFKAPILNCKSVYLGRAGGHLEIVGMQQAGAGSPHLLGGAVREGCRYSLPHPAACDSAQPQFWV